MYPHERSLVKELAGEPFALIGVNSDAREDALAAVEREQMTWRSFYNGGSTGGPISMAWGVRSWPTIYVIDDRGVIRYKNLRGDALTDAVVELIDRSLPKLLEHIRSDDPQVRSLAAFRLGQSEAPDAAKLVEPLVGDADPIVRRRAAVGLALVSAPTEKLQPLLVEAVGDQETEVRIAALSMLAKARHPQTLTLARAALKDELVEMRLAAIEALGATGAAEAVPLLRDVVRDDRQLAREAIDALVLLRLPPAIEALRAMAKDARHPARVWLAVALHEAGEPGTAERFGRLLHDPELNIRRAALTSLATLPDFDPLDLMGQALLDEDPMIARGAQTFLARNSSPRAAEILNRFLTKRVDVLVRKMSNSDFREVMNAQNQLRQLGPEVAPLLIDRIDEVPHATQLKLAQIIGYSENEEALETALGKLRTTELELANRYVYESIVRYFAFRSRSQVRQGAVELVQADQPEVRVSGVQLLGMFRDAEAIEMVESHLTDKAPEVRWRAAAALSNSRDPRALEVLSAAVAAVDHQQAAVVAAGLANYGAEKAVPLLSKLGTRQPADFAAAVIPRLGRFNTEAATRAVVQLAASDLERRRLAVYALSRQRSAAAADALAEYLKTDDAAFRTQVVAALKRMRISRADEILKQVED